jgi:hypothetical protein
VLLVSRIEYTELFAQTSLHDRSQSMNPGHRRSYQSGVTPLINRRIYSNPLWFRGDWYDSNYTVLTLWVANHYNGSNFAFIRI